MQIKFPNVLSELLSKVLRIIKAWKIEKGIGVNYSKTELVIFMKRHKKDFKRPKLHDIMLEVKTQASIYRKYKIKYNHMDIPGGSQSY